MNELFADAVDYLSYRLIKKSAWYDFGVANERKKMTKKAAAQMKDRTFSIMDPLWITTFLQDFKAGCV